MNYSFETIGEKRFTGNKFPSELFQTTNESTCTKRRHFVPLTLATGRKSKFAPLEGDAARKRDQRRRRNREAARKLKQKRLLTLYQLENQIAYLEYQEKLLLSHIDSLRTYKYHLEDQVYFERTHFFHQPSRIIQRPIRSLSPQWQLLLRI